MTPPHSPIAAHATRPPQMTFLGCMIPSEFSWHTLAALVGVVVWYWRQQPERTPELHVARALNGVAAAVLGFMSWQSSQARHVFRAAFQRAGIRGTPSLARSVTPMRVAITALPSPTLLMNQIEVRRSQVYAHVGYKGTKKLKLDLYWHTARLRKPGAPVFLYIHGESSHTAPQCASPGAPGMLTECRL